MAIYESEFKGAVIDARLAAVTTMQTAISNLETAVAAKYSKPANGIPETDLDAAVQSALAKARSAVQDLSSYYTKTEIDSLLAAINSQEYIDVTVLPTASASTLGKIYLVGPDADSQYARYYTSYDGSSYSWVAAGTTEVNLANYATKTEVNQLNQKVDDLDDEINAQGGEPNYTAGTVVKANGATASADGWGMTDFIPYTQGNAVVWNFGGANSGSYVLQFYDSSKNAINNGYWGASGTDGVKTISVNDISRYASNGAFMKASFRLDNESASVSVGGNVAWTPQVSQPGIAARVSALESEMASRDSDLVTLQEKVVATDLETLTLSQTNDKYINSGGTVASSANFAYTEPFTLKTGDAIIFEGAGYSTSVAMLSSFAGGSVYTPIIVSEDNQVHTWQYVNMGPAARFVLSYNYTKAHSCKKVVNKQVEALADSPLSTSATQMIIAGIPVVGIIGDSLSVGQTYDENDNPHTNLAFAWWQVLKRDGGTDYKSFASGGTTTQSWFTKSECYAAAMAAGNECCAYVIALGVNDQFSLGPSYLGTAADVNLSDPTQNADSFYGNYAKIIQLLSAHVPNCKFFALTVPRRSGNYPSFNAAIRALAAMFDNCYLVDLEADYYDVFQSPFVQSQTFGGSHHSAMAYQYIGKIMEKAIGDTIAANSVDFRYIQFVLDE